MVKQCGGTVQQCWLNSETVMVEAWNSDSRTVWVEQCGGTVLVEQWDSNAGTVKVEQ